MAFNLRIGLKFLSFYSKLNFHSFSQIKSDLFSLNALVVVPNRNFGRKVKRRINHPFRWWTKRRADSFKNSLSKDNQEFIDEYVKEKYSHLVTPLKQNLLEKKDWTPNSKRVGLIARKIGVYPMWLKDGKRILTTLLQVNDNHVIKCYTSKEFKSNAIYQERWRYHNMGCAIIGAESDHPMKYAAPYFGLFVNAGVLPKKKIAKMLISDDAILAPGTPLFATHFRVGDWVDVYGKTIDHNFQGVMKRWDFAGGPTGRNTKFDRRPGSISRGRKACGPFKGRKMPGHMGSERRTLPGVQIMRINTKLNVIYVRGPAVPGEIGNWVYIFDTFIKEKKLDENSIPPPFPTYFPEEEKETLPEDIYHPNVHPMNDKTIVFVETEEEKKTARIGAKLAKVRTKK